MSAAIPSSRLLSRGQPAPWFRAQALSGSDTYTFDTAAGRPILMLFFGTARHPQATAAIGLVAARRSLFDDENACFYGVTVDPSDEAEGRIAQSLPGIRWFLDYDKAVSRLFGAMEEEGDARYAPHWLVIDAMLRIVERFPIDQGERAVAALEAEMKSSALPDWAPVLMVPGVLEPALCRALIDLYERDGGEESGYMRDVGGKTVLVTNKLHKVRRDCLVEDSELQQALKIRFVSRLAPMVRRAFQFEPTRMERFLIGCYDAESGGHFRPHRDNTTKGTAHRRFAVTVNLNAGDYEGGNLRFPEYGRRTYCPPTGGAVVFSCSLLHEATPITRGTRYAFLPFLYDEEAATQREENSRYLDEGLGGYRKT
jgi:predicted 2-oxoglutarate/Fe(II)-dependent dioxygenase YbiX/peroxiredoxin